MLSVTRGNEWVSETRMGEDLSLVLSMAEKITVASDTCMNNYPPVSFIFLRFPLLSICILCFFASVGSGLRPRTQPPSPSLSLSPPRETFLLLFQFSLEISPINPPFTDTIFQWDFIHTEQCFFLIFFPPPFLYSSQCLSAFPTVLWLQSPPLNSTSEL